MNSENKNVKVLLVDDDTLLGNELAEQLAGYGYTVSHFSSVKDIAATIDAMQPDVLVFDVEIGTENGIEAAQSLYDGNPSLPIIFISSHHADEMKEKGLRAGGVAYLDKPFTPKLLAAHIDRFARMTKSNTATFSNLMPIGTTQLDTKNRVLIFEDGSIADLRPMEFVILREFVNHLNEIVSREDVYLAVWGRETAYYNEQSLNNYIRRLRTVLERDDNVEITLHRGLGYKLKVKTEN